MKTATDVGLLFRRYWLQILRTPVWLVMSLVSPILYLALFTPLLKPLTASALVPGGTALNLFLPGILALVAYGTGVAPGFTVTFELGDGVVERYRVTPASRFAILLGPILATASQMLLFDAVLVALGAALGFSVHWEGLGVLAALLVLLEVTTAAFLTGVALVVRQINGFAAVANGLNLPILLLGGVLLPISLGPAWLRDVAHADPLYYVVAASRTLAAGHFGAPAVWHAFAVLVPLCAVTLVWATRVLRRVVA